MIFFHERTQSSLSLSRNDAWSRTTSLRVPTMQVLISPHAAPESIEHIEMSMRHDRESLNFSNIESTLDLAGSKTSFFQQRYHVRFYFPARPLKGHETKRARPPR